MSGMADCTKNVAETTENISSIQTDAKPVPRRSFFHLVCKMVSDLLIIGFILSTIFVFVQNSNQPLIRGARKPTPFFPQNSTVRDYWNGEVFQGFKDAAYYESSFFLFYAAWDRESQEARAELEAVAAFFSESDILVAAVNCWYPTSDCAKEFGGKGGSGNILPVLIYYPKSLSGIQYRGLVKAQHMIRFIQNCRYPVTHLHSHQHFQHLQVEYESVLLGYLPATSSHSIDFNHQELHKAAYSLLEVYPEKQTAVGVVTSEQLAKQLHLYSSQPVRLYTANSTHVYPNKTIDSEKLLLWSLKNMSPTSSWLNLPGSKSQTLRRVLEGGSGNVLLIFSPRTSFKKDKIFNLLRQVSTDYLNCDKHPAVDSLVDRLRRMNEGLPCSGPTPSPSTTTDPSSCRLRSWSYDSRDETFPPCSVSSSCSVPPSSNRSCAPNASLVEERRRGERLREHYKDYYDYNIRLLLDEVEAEERREKRIEGREEEEEGAQLGSGEGSSNLDIRGLGCNSNASLRMYRVDSDSYRSLLNSLGLEDQTLPLPVILNVKEEAVYLPAQFRPGHFVADLKMFLVSWHSGQLSNSQGFRSTHTGSTVRFQGSERTKGPEQSVIDEVSAATFDEVTTSKKDVVLFYTSSFCTHCSAASHVFHTVKLYMETVQSIRFLVVDATKNDLNWQFTALSYPTVIYFPRNRSDLSRVFPVTARLDVRNLLSFIVANMEPVHRIKLALQHCDKHCADRLRLLAGSTVSQLTAKLRRSGHMQRSSKRRTQRRLSLAKNVLYVLSAVTEEDANQSSQMPRQVYETIVENFLLGAL